jgi:hypothetical protein
MRKGEFEWEWWKSRGLRELAGLRRFCETVEMCGKVGIEEVEIGNTKFEIRLRHAVQNRPQLRTPMWLAYPPMDARRPA